ncbi:hypothetical protein NO559_09680 [Dasania sp. GY-MA-18]|uniref:MSHA biogenesis protein MshI n=1 Tax=Dasania phycosphaerae TaxID=2950436 RepID=A0A9J6RM73_9GAMM|nr:MULTISPECIES: hypothetical protein [Dasania]MCR8923043.1 hypothetical protein [Dasania sp. GY-MA-18]MCZ0865474.1 hypothetical protein [Dasania phycosphaerae]MCZ0869199.1 hypothetical protein [Dasania phycosphaerae]
MKITIPWLKNNNTVSGRVGVAMGPDGLSVAHINAAGVVDFCQNYPQPGDSADLLSSLVTEQGWHACPCSLVLHPLYYQLTLAESPAVEAAEMAEAVRWRLKDFVDYPLADAAVDFFTLPDDAYRGRKAMLYAAVMRKNSLQGLAETIEQAGLVLQAIEISELALHNLCYALPEVRGGVAILHLLEDEGFINLVEDGNIYLSRKLDIGLASFDGEGDHLQQFEALLLEIQRSLDFYESQLGKGIISNLYYSPATERTVAMGEFLAMQLGLNVAPLNVKGLLQSELPAETLATAITAIGAATGPGKQKDANAEQTAEAVNAAY